MPRTRSESTAIWAVLVVVLVILLVIAALRGGFSTGQVHAGAQQPIKICMQPKVVGIPYFNATEEGARQAAAELHVQLDYRGPTQALAADQVQIVEQWIQQGCSAITVSANDPDALAPALKKAEAAGIAVGSWDADVAPDARQVFANQTTFAAIGQALVDTLAQQTGGKGKFLVITGSLTAPNQNAWIKEMKKRMTSKYPGMSIATVLPGEEDLQTGIDITKNYLQGHPDTAGVFGITSVALPGVAEAVKQLGLAGKVKVTGVSDPVVVKSYMDAGIIQKAVLWNPIDLGYLAVYIAKALVQKQMPTSGTFQAGHLGPVKLLQKDVVLLGPPLVYSKKDVGKYSF